MRIAILVSLLLVAADASASGNVIPAYIFLLEALTLAATLVYLAFARSRLALKGAALCVLLIGTALTIAIDNLPLHWGDWPLLGTMLGTAATVTASVRTVRRGRKPTAT